MPKAEDQFCVLGGNYSLGDIARILLLAAGSETTANRALRAAIKQNRRPLKRRANDDMLFLAARKIQLQLRAKGKRCSDFTAIKKLEGAGWRTLYRKYEKRGLSLKQIALLYVDYIGDKTTLTF